MSSHLARFAAWTLLLALCLSAPAPRLLAGGEEDDDAPAAKTPKCTCASRNACWHYLKAPVAPPNDPCWCPTCAGDSRHDGSKPIEGWNADCWLRKSVDCFLRKHAASWRITCFDCLEETKCCDFKNQARCPACGDADLKDPFAKDAFGKDARTTIAERAPIETKVFEKKRPAIAYSKHFYVVTDIPKAQIRCQGGGFRYVDAHEYAHVMLERAEKAYREFDEAFGGRIGLLRPMGIFLPQRETTAFAIREAYFRNKNAPMVYSSYAGAAESAISQGFCLNGLCVSMQQAGGDDADLYHSVRHLIGNILVTCWCGRSGDNAKMPRWVFEGAAHWLAKRHPDLADGVWYCIGEERKMSGSGKMWMKDLADIATKGKFAPIEQFLSKSSLGQLTLEDHKRAWGIFELCMAEWHDPFVALLADFRKEADTRDAFEKHLGCSPEEFDVRIVERLAGLRKTMTSARWEKEIAAKLDIREGDKFPEIAQKIRALGTITDAGLVKQVIDVIGRFDSDLVRETALVALRKVTKEECVKVIWEYGLTHSDRLVRAYTGRLCRLMRIAEAKDALRKMMDDGFWMAKCEAMLAAATLKDFSSQGKMRELVEDSSGKVRIGAMDALAMFGTDVNDSCIPVIAKNLNHPDWQLRLTAAQDLRILGSYLAIDPLISRMEIESGRVFDEILRALTWISQEDFGKKPEVWRAWWDRESGRVKERKGFEPKPKVDTRYANQKPEGAHYYGVELFSQRVGFVLDVSRSTNRKFNPDESTRTLLHGSYENATIFEIARDEVAGSVKSLDPRAFFNVIAFGSEIRRMERAMVPASQSNKDKAASFVNSYQANGETNFYGALSAALELDAETFLSANLRDTLDTMVFLTDGTPTVGEITERDMILDWFGELNRYFRVRLHAYAFGALEVDEELLRKLAERNEGRFTQLFEEN